MFDATITVVRDASWGKGWTWYRALFYDRASATFYAGTGETVWEALAWALDDFIARTMFGLPHSVARRADARPGDRFAVAAAGRPADTVLARGGFRAAAAASIDDDVKPPSAGCFDTTIPRAAEPMLLTDIPKKSAAARRSSVRKAKSK